jgi:hypothetical protein
MPSRHAIATCLSLACALVMASAEPAVEASGKASNRKVLVDPIVLPTASDANSTAMSTGLPDNYVQVCTQQVAREHAVRASRLSRCTASRSFGVYGKGEEVRAPYLRVSRY